MLHYRNSVPQNSLHHKNLNPSFVKNFHRAISLNGFTTRQVPQLSEVQCTDSKITLLNSPEMQKKSFSNSKLPAIPCLSSTVKSSRPHGIIKAYCANTHKGLFRSVNEDRVMIISKIPKPEHKAEKWPVCAYFAVFDGHMGKECSSFLRNNLHNYIIDDKFFPSNPSKAIRNAFAKAEETFCSLAIQKNLKSGACALVALFINSTCFIANLGNSRAVLCESSSHKITQISTDHVPNDLNEKRRIQLAGGTVVVSKDPFGQVLYRIMPGGLKVSRSIGDVDLKVQEYGTGTVISFPDIKVIKIHSDSDFLLLASDGIFEKIENKELVSMIWDSAKESKEADFVSKIGKAVERIMVEAMIRNSQDNLTTILIGFKNFDKVIDGESGRTQ